MDPLMLAGVALLLLLLSYKPQRWLLAGAAGLRAQKKPEKDPKGSNNIYDFGIGALIATIAAAAVISTTGTLVAAHQQTQAAKNRPKIKPPLPPPAAPPPPPDAPPVPTELEAQAGIGNEKKRRQARFGVRQTILASPLGRSSGDAGSTLLGG